MKKYLPYILYAAIALFLMRPFLAPGFLFLLDMSWAPSIQISDYISAGINSNFPLVLIFKLLSYILPLQIVQKILLGLIFFLAGMFMFRFAKENKIGTKWAFASGLFYMINPWMYERFLAGHWLVMLGYAFFPLAFLLFLRLTKSSSRLAYWKLAALLAVYPILNLHWAYITFLFLIFSGLFYLWSEKKWSLFKSFSFVKKILLIPLIFLAVNSFWLFSFWDTASVWPKISLNDFKTFATSADPVFGAYFNVLSLYGYWQDIYFLPKDFLALWWLVSLLVLSLSAIGICGLLKEKKFLAYLIAILFLPVLVVAVGLGTSFSSGIVEFLFYTLPGFKGLRETAKLGGLLAFFLALLYAVGAKTLLTHWWETERKSATIFKNAFYVIVVAIPFLSCYGMFQAFNTQVRPYNYPVGWEKVEARLAQDQNVNKVLFLPWHGYPVLNFAGHKKIANPAASYFSVPIVQGKNIDNVYLLETDQGEWDRYITSIVQGLEKIDNTSEFLNQEGISHIILAKIHDYQSYQFLLEAESLTNIYEDDDIILFGREQ